MSVFKIVGKITRILEGGAELELVTKQYVRAEDKDSAEQIALTMGIKGAEVSYFGTNRVSLGCNEHYAADNGYGILPGC